MKRTIRRLALALALVLALSAAAMATGLTYTHENADKNVHAVSLQGSKCTLSFDGDKLNVTYTDSNLQDGDMVIVFLLETADQKEVESGKETEKITPTSTNIKYIDQGTAEVKTTAENGSVSFGVYPKNHTNAVVRIISVNKAGTLTDVNVAAVKLDFTYGDVDGNKIIDVRDALAILQYFTNNEVQLAVPQAADVDGIAGVDVRDALRVLQHFTDNSVILGK